MSKFIDQSWHEPVRERLCRWINPEDRILIAVSGGADSMGLLSLLADKFRWPNNHIVVGHVNHGIRSDVNLDEELIREACAQRGLDCETEKVDTPAFSRERRLSMEAAARFLRYQSLEKIADRTACSWILTGHTMDDSAETVWMRMVSGAPWYEWTGIPERRGRILRPLLAVNRAELRGWLGEATIPYRDDSTNLDLRHLRNRLRLEMSHKQWFWSEETIQTLAESGANLLRLIEIVKKLIRLRLWRARTEGLEDRIGLEIDGIFRYFNSLNFLPVEAAWADLAGHPEARLASVFRRQIPPFLAGSSPQSTLPLPYNITALRRGAKVWLFRESVSPVHIPVSLGSWDVPERKGILSLRRVGREAADDANGSRISIRYADKPLHLRSWRAGERLKPQGRPTKKISALLAERKLDPIARECVVVLADEVGPILIPGIAVAQRAVPDPRDPEVLLVRWKTYHGTQRHDDC